MQLTLCKNIFSIVPAENVIIRFLLAYRQLGKIH